jgi:hypothetical protein
MFLWLESPAGQFRFDVLTLVVMSNLCVVLRNCPDVVRQ